MLTQEGDLHLRRGELLDCREHGHLIATSKVVEGTCASEFLSLRASGQLGSEAIRGNPQQSVAIGGSPSQSIALSRTQSKSIALSRTQSHSVALSRTQSHSGALRCTQVHSGALRCKQVHLGVEPELFADDDGRLIQFSSLEMRQCHLRRPHEYKTTRGTQWHSVALSGTQWYASEWGRASSIWQHPRYSEVI